VNIEINGDSKKSLFLVWAVIAAMLLVSGCGIARTGVSASDTEGETETSQSLIVAQSDLLAREFLDPPSSAKPGVYWYFMDGNQNRDEMTADLEAMAAVGIGSVIFLEVNIGVPRGPVDFMSEEWQDNFVHAVKTTERLGMELILGTGPGWAGSGGPWIEPENSMQHLVAGTTEVSGPGPFEGFIEVPTPPSPNTFHGMSDALAEVRERWYQDVAVLAFPTPEDPAQIELLDLKTLKETQPYSIWKYVPRYIAAPASYEEPNPSSVIDPETIIDLSDMMAVDGTLAWDVPEGDWTIMRFVSRTTGQTTRPAPEPGHGFETDKFNPASFEFHWENFQQKLLDRIGPREEGVGWTRIHLDSWEMSSQNWTQTFGDEFSLRRGYDPTPYYPAYAGMVVSSLEQTERFLWDLRKTAQELVIENYAETIKAKAHENGMLYSNQPYDMNPAGNIDLGSVADIPSCEFWDYRNSDLVDSLYSCIEATSIAHVMGRPIVTAEAFTSAVPLRFHSYPGQMKNQTDWALALGINSLVFALFQHQPLGDEYLPGMSLGPHGVNWHRHQNWWDMLPAYHQYISRASHLLQQGVAVADILYLLPEGVPHIFLPPPSAMEGEGVMQNRLGYSFDAVSPRILISRAEVENGRIAFPDATEYKLLVLPDSDTMTPETLQFIMQLVESGATVVGNPPLNSPSLVNFPASDMLVRTLAADLWGGLSVPENTTLRSFGAGTVYWGHEVYSTKDDGAVHYPSYDLTSSLLQSMGLDEDFSASVESLRYAHRRTENQEIYFVSNRLNSAVDAEATFRVSGVQPELWHPETGERRALPEYEDKLGAVTIPLAFAAFESFFVVFSKEVPDEDAAIENFPIQNVVMALNGSWDVSFNPERGGPDAIEFDELQNWSQHSESGIRYYSGIATYSKAFDLPGALNPDADYLIDLGKAFEMARVSLNGVELGVAWTHPWRVRVGDAMKAKNNLLTVELANSWENRLIGDEASEFSSIRTVQWENGLLGGQLYSAGQYTFTTYPSAASYFGAVEIEEAQLQPSGLLGPVRIIGLDQ